MFARLAFACLIAHALVQFASARAEELERLPGLAETEPVVQLESFTSESGWLARWRTDHQRRAAEDGWIQTDRPSFTLSASTVPKGWIQLESGYTYAYAHKSFTNNDPPFEEVEISQYTNTLPELNFRWGITNWAELRILWAGDRTLHARVTVDSDSELFDLSATANLGVGGKFQITQQKGWLPKSAFVTTVFLPTADPDSGIVPFIDYIYVWSLTDRLSLGGSTGAYFADLTKDIAVMRFFQSVILRFHWSPEVSIYGEWYTGAQELGGETIWSPMSDAGIQWRPLANLQFDWRVGLPLGGEFQMDGVFTGVGASLRY